MSMFHSNINSIDNIQRILYSMQIDSFFPWEKKQMNNYILFFDYTNLFRE